MIWCVFKVVAVILCVNITDTCFAAPIPAPCKGNNTAPVQASHHSEVSVVAKRHHDEDGDNEVFKASAFVNDGSNGGIPSVGVTLVGIENDLGKFVTVEAELGAGAMARTQLFDTRANIKGPWRNLNIKYGLDTGILYTDGMELKVLGAGFYAGKQGFEICVIFCVGYKV